MNLAPRSRLKRSHPHAEPPGAAALLDAVPMVNRSVAFERRGDRTVVFVPLNTPWWFRPPLTWVLPVRRRRGYELDRLGRSVLDLCDGQRSVERIVERFAEQHRVAFHEARAAVVEFLRRLVARQVVALVVTGESAAGAGARPAAAGARRGAA